jgi:hypothetical protein
VENTAEDNRTPALNINVTINTGVLLMKDLDKLAGILKLSQICKRAGINNESLTVRKSKGSELTAAESEAITNELKKNNLYFIKD